MESTGTAAGLGGRSIAGGGRVAARAEARTGECVTSVGVRGGDGNSRVGASDGERVRERVRERSGGIPGAVVA